MRKGQFSGQGNSTFIYTARGAPPTAGREGRSAYFQRALRWRAGGSKTRLVSKRPNEHHNGYNLNGAGELSTRGATLWVDAEWFL